MAAFSAARGGKAASRLEDALRPALDAAPGRRGFGGLGLGVWGWGVWGLRLRVWGFGFWGFGVLGIWGFWGFGGLGVWVLEVWGFELEA